ncbi:MAG: 3-hydroxyacyl-CoA dehydrogenase NAD-binding domain-containing protein [Methylacidiphilales bacterium]|nr:3-hydroxyacyl-CoA dehydrogenase NAD-binding domain-containing protein [Candidatus Methylacidiphilales bacterium]
MITITYHNSLAIISCDHPPVNTINQAIRKGLISNIQAAREQGAKAILIRCKGKTFFSGADLNEFDFENPPSPTLPDVISAMQTCPIPIIVSLHGTTFGGGLEIAMAASYRIAEKQTKLGLPETSLGVIPGAGGTQHLPRLIPLEQSITMILEAKPIDATTALELGLLDKVTEHETFEQDALEYSLLIANQSSPRKDCSQIQPQTISVEKQNELISNAKTTIAKKYKGHIAQCKALELIQDAYRLPYLEARAKERQVFLELRKSLQSKALRHVFFAERNVAKATQKKNITSIIVIGGGTMGRGIALACAGASVTTHLFDINNEILKQAQTSITQTITTQEEKNLITKQQAQQTLSHLHYNSSLPQEINPTMCIEAVIEDPSIKKTIFAQLQASYPQAIIASNTSYLDLEAITETMPSSTSCVGLHFFNPADRMKLLEIIKIKKTNQDTLDYCLTLASLLKKIPIVVNHCFGFAANRLYTVYNAENNLMLLEGMSPEIIDQAYLDFGMAMGPCEVLDSSGIDVGYLGRKNNPNPPQDPRYFAAINSLAQHSLLGKKTNAGFYLYQQGKKTGVNPRALELIKAQADILGVSPNLTALEQIPVRSFTKVCAEANQMIQEGIIDNQQAVDLLWIHGYGYPRIKGGPMFSFNNTL